MTPPEDGAWFYVQSLARTKVDGPVVWWCPDAAGYTTSILEAGVFHREQVLRQAERFDNGVSTKAWAVAVVRPIAHVAARDLGAVPQ